MPIHLSMWDVLVLSFVLTAAVGDVRWRRIPRALTVSGLLAGLAFHAVSGGFGSSLLAACVGLATGFLFFQLGAIGGGDVKLMAALGALLGFKPWLFAMEMAVLAAGAIALLQVLRRRMLRQTVANMGETIRWVGSTGLKAHPIINVANASMLRAPFGVAAALGTIVLVTKPYWAVWVR